MRKLALTVVPAFVLFAGIGDVWAQVFNSGSTGALGAFSPATNTVVTLPGDGILNYTTVTIPAGVTVTFQRNALNTPVTLLATGNVTIGGIINVNGQNGITATGAGAGPIPGGLGGPGGWDGGQTGSLSAGTGQNGSPGRGFGAQPGLFTPTTNTSDAVYGPDTMVGLIPLFGGSGGGGGGRIIGGTINGGSGAGGGGAIVIASTTQIALSAGGQIVANGGARIGAPCSYQTGGGGSGGAIRLVAPTISNQGTIQAVGGSAVCPGPTAGAGRIRVEAFSFPIFNTTNPLPSLVTSPGPVTAASTPALTSVPTLKIATINGLVVPASPSGAYATPDIILPPGTTSPVTVTLTATNTPPGTIFRIQTIPQGALMVVPTDTAPSTGTCTSSTASATVAVPAGQVAAIKAYSAAFDFSCP